MEAAQLHAIAQALKDLRFGTVQLVVHEGKMIRIERVERIRLSPDCKEKEPTGAPGGLIHPQADRPL